MSHYLKTKRNPILFQGGNNLNYNNIFTFSIFSLKHLTKLISFQSIL